MPQPRIHIRWYLLTDLAGALFTWWLFYYLRTLIYDYPFSVPAGFYLGALLYTLGWLSLHYVSGAYSGIYHKTALTEFFRTLFVSVLGCLALLFIFILKNPQDNNLYYYKEFLSLLLPNFAVTLFFRLLLLGRVKSQLAGKKVFFNVLLIGSGKTAGDFYESFVKTNAASGYLIRSFLNTNGHHGLSLPAAIHQYRGLEELPAIIRRDRIEEVIITVDKTERPLLTRILQQLSDQDVNIKITPDAVDIISGAVQTSDVMGMPLMDVHSGLMPSWQQHCKRLLDLFIAFTGGILLSPLLLYSALRTALSSPGPVLYRQERLGYKGKPFYIWKFRSMVQDAEKNGPMLSTEDDERITRWGRVMRKWRLDELPQLWNIIRGEMSLVGPRPERRFYVDQIVQQHPEYKYLFKVKPGLTSWGMVKFGYASTVEEMIRRMTFDLMYVENVSLLLDLRIMILTIATILKGKGR